MEDGNINLSETIKETVNPQCEAFNIRWIKNEAPIITAIDCDGNRLTFDGDVDLLQAIVNIGSQNNDSAVNINGASFTVSTKEMSLESDIIKMNIPIFKDSAEAELDTSLPITAIYTSSAFGDGRLLIKRKQT